jgi:hypothetical protein
MSSAGPGDALTPGRLSRIRASLPDLRDRRRSPSAVPRVAFTREDARRLNERFALLGRPERRAIVRAVNRGEAMQKRRDAELAVGVARRQQRFWSRAWLLGPSIAIVQVLLIPTITWQQGVLLAIWGSLLLGMMAAWWWTRARRAELLNLEKLGTRGLGSGKRESGRGDGRSTRPDTSSRGTPRRSRLPGGSPSSRSTDGDDAAHLPDTRGPEVDGEHITARPARPRGRKRR